MRRETGLFSCVYERYQPYAARDWFADVRDPDWRSIRSSAELSLRFGKVGICATGVFWMSRHCADNIAGCWRANFYTVAGTPGMSPLALRVALETPHHSMPNLMLTANELRNVTAYIMSLQ